MENRGRKRTELDDQLPADKRACSSLEFRPSTSCLSVQTQSRMASTSENRECDMEASTSASVSGRSESEADKDSTYGSCDSDGMDDEEPRQDGFRDYHPRRSSEDRAKFKRIMSSLDEEADPCAQLAALTELCDFLSFCTEDSIYCLSLDPIASLLVKLANHESSADIMLLSTRAITYLCDVLPRSAAILIRQGVVPALCARLMAIEYLDVAEQCLQALEKISHDHPQVCLQDGAIMAVLKFIDFFSTSVQRVALSTVANICKKLPSDCSSHCMEAIPMLCNILQYEDLKLVESVATCLIRIVERAGHSSELLSELCKHGLVQQAVHLIAANSRIVTSQPINTGLIGLLARLATGSVAAVRILFEINIGSTMKNVLSCYDVSHCRAYPLPVEGHSNQVHEALKLLNELLPSLTKDHDNQLEFDKEKILVDHPELLQQFGMDILPVFIQLVNSGANLYTCYGCLSVINKLVYFSRSDMLLHLLKINTNISSFLAGLFARKDHHVLISALRIVETILKKLPDVFLDSFVKEGVVYAIDAFLISEKFSPSTFSVFSYLQLSSGSNKKSSARDVHKCLCYAFDQSPFSELGTCKLQKDSVQTLASEIKATYFSAESDNPEIGLTKTLQKLRVFSALLTEKVNMSMNNDICPQNEENLYCILHQVVSELNGREPMSTFEFIESGILKSLANYLSNGQYLKEKLEHHCIFSHSHVALKRLEMFLNVSLPSMDQPRDMPLAILVRKLQSALSALESFPVVLSHVSKPRNSYATVPKGRYIKQPCLKVRFIREDRETGLCDYSADVVTVEPFSSLEAIESFLWPKVCTNRDENHMKSANQSVNKPDCPPLPVPCDARAPHGEEPKFMEANSISSVSSEQEDVAKPSHSPEKVVLTPKEASPGETSASLGQESTSQDFQFLLEMDTGRRTDDSANANTAGYVSSSIEYKEGRQYHESCVDDFPKLIFYLEQRQLNRELTLYQAVLEQQVRDEREVFVGPKFWNEVHKIKYRKAAEPECRTTQEHLHGSKISAVSNGHEKFWQNIPFLSHVLVSELDFDLAKSNPVYDVLFMLKSLEALNRFAFQLMSHARRYVFAEGRNDRLDDLRVTVPVVPQDEFINSKLTEKLEQQITDPLAVSIGGIPSWCNHLMNSCPFLFSFEIKCKYFRLMVFSSLHVQPHPRPQSTDNNSITSHDRRPETGGLPRKKFHVSRRRILDSAAEMMDLHARHTAIIEVEYNEEVGTGQGPTMEFYTLVSHEFQKDGLGMWREDHCSVGSQKGLNGEDSEFLVAPLGLFPRPWSASMSTSNGIQFTEVIKKFVLLGQIMAKALQDGRVLDIHFSKAFYKLILGQELTIYDIQSFDPTFGKSLLELQALVDRKNYFESVPQKGMKMNNESCFHATSIEDLCLDFTLPGYPDYILASGSDHNMVNMSNLEEYVALTLDATVNTGILRQMAAFISGFNQVFPIKNLQIFTEEELERLLCGERNSWAVDELMDHIKFDHGYTASSPPVIHLLEIIQEFDCEQRRAFLQFVTGAPRLPPGGLAALNPKLTIVRKHCSECADGDLPSVMTCANYLKLPPYSSKERMRERLLYAIKEGQGSFHLS